VSSAGVYIGTIRGGVLTGGRTYDRIATSTIPTSWTTTELFRCDINLGR
jgi:hypothetical protein